MRSTIVKHLQMTQDARIDIERAKEVRQGKGKPAGPALGEVAKGKPAKGGQTQQQVAPPKTGKGAQVPIVLTMDNMTQCVSQAVAQAVALVVTPKGKGKDKGDKGKAWWNPDAQTGGQRGDKGKKGGKRASSQTPWLRVGDATTPGEWHLPGSSGVVCWPHMAAHHIGALPCRMGSDCWNVHNTIIFQT